ncbi:host specificity protein J [Methylomonas sp. MED-D]|uniref:host specificity protein J n=1 Tax=Methylomonas sp. MED-D TaxID=3418768 RepID=UPI003D022D68
MSKPISMVGGAMGGGGGGGSSRAPVIARDTARSESKLEIVEAFGWGEIEGFPAGEDPLKYVYLDGTVVRNADGSYNHQGVTFDWRPGTQDQTYIPGTIGDAVGTPESVGVSVVHATPIVRSITDPAVDAVRIILIFEALYKTDTSTGDRKGVTVDVQIEVKPAGGSWHVIDLQGRGTVKDKTESPYQRGFDINLREVDSSATSWDIRVSRNSADPASNEQSAFSWDLLVKLTYAKLRRPNVAYCRIAFDTKYFSQIPSRSYDLLGWKCLVPPASVYNPVARTYTGADWDGTLIKAWCNNPAWFLYTLLVTAGHGLGEHIDAAYQDKWQIYALAQRCDTLVDNGFGATEHLYSIDYQFMAQTPALDMLQQIAGIFDSQALWNGTAVYLAQDAPKTARTLYLPANVRGGRFEYAGTGRQTRYTAALIQWNDPADEYRLATEYVEDRDGLDRYGYRPKTETAIGCVSRGQAHRHGKRLLSTARRETDTVTFSVGLTGLLDSVGDVFRIADPLRDGGQRYGGRILAGATATVIPLDAPVTLADGVVYRLAVIGNDGTVWDESIATAAGTHSTITLSAPFAEAPSPMLEWIVYDPAAAGKLWRLLSIAENDDPSNGDGFYTISATQYDPDKFAEIAAIGELAPVPTSPYIVSAVVPPSGLSASEGTYVGLEGVRRYLDIHWSASTDKLLRGYRLAVRRDGVPLLDSEVYGQGYRIDNPLPGVYDITIAAVNLPGKSSVSISISHTLGELYAIEAVSITSLQMPSGTGEFTGRSAQFAWNTDAATVLGNTAYASGQGGSSPWFRDFEVRVYTTGGALLRTDYVTEYLYTYTYDRNVEDGGPRRSFKVNVRARDYFGRYSNAAELTASNPEPTDFSGVSLEAGLGQVFVKFTEPSDPDYETTNVYASQSAHFTPGPSNLVAPGVGRLSAFPAAATGSWYVKLQGVDAFGAASTYSTEFSVVVSALDVTSLVDDVLADPGRAGDIIVEATRFLVVPPSATSPAVAMFGTGYVNGVFTVGVRGDLAIDGSIYGRSIAAGTITADKLTVAQLSAIVADLGTVTAGTLKTSNGTGHRVEISDSGLFPLWYGSGAKTAGNGLFYLDTSGNPVFKGQLSGATGTFSGALSSGTINCGSGQFTVDGSGNAVSHSLTVYDALGNIVFQSSAGGIDSAKVLNQAGDNLLPNPDLYGALDGGLTCADWTISVSGVPAIVGFSVGAGYGPLWDSAAPVLRVYLNSADDVVNLASAGKIAIDPAQPVNLSAWLVKDDGSGAILIRCYCYDSSGTLIDATDVTVSPTSSWSRISAIFGPGGAAYRAGTRSVSFGLRLTTASGLVARATRFTLNVGINPCVGVGPYNQTTVSNVNRITAGNRSTYIASAAIGNAEMDRATANKLQVVEADIVDLNVTTIKIENEAVIVPRYGFGDDLVTLSVTLPIGTTVNLIATCQATVWDLDSSQTLYLFLDSTSGTELAKNKFEAYAGGRFSTTIAVTTQYVTTAATTTFVAYANGGSRTKDTTLLLIGTKR